MSDIINALKKTEKLYVGNPVENSEIEKSEAELGLKFSPEYREYLKKYGFASYLGHELTGICNSARLNVVKVTQEARETYQYIDNDMYVIEDTGFEGILILQNRKGALYQIRPHEKPLKICSSLAAYIQK